MALTLGCGPGRGSGPNEVEVLQGALEAGGEDGVQKLLQDAARAFYARHGDDFDELVVWADPRLYVPMELYLPESNEVRGLGQPLLKDALGLATQRLRGIVCMGSNWAEPAGDVDAASSGPRALLGVLAQETAHRWGVYVTHRADDGSDRTDLLGRESKHWSFFVDSGGSPLGGNAWVALGGNLYTAASPVGIAYSPLDLYLMGAVDASDVPPVRRLVPDAPCGACAWEDQTSTSVTFTATEERIPIEQIIASVGPRDPPGEGARARAVRQAWIYLSPDGDAPWLGLLEPLRLRWERVFGAATGGRMAIETRMSP
jgi:hypothetical protein